MMLVARAAPLVFALLLVGCVSDPAEVANAAEEQQQVADDIEAILTQPLDKDEYAKGERCISTFQYHSVDVLDNEHVVFKGSGGKLWLNTLRTPCIGLRRRDVLRFELRGSQLCNLDDFVAIDPTRSIGARSSATCALGDFEPITKEQVTLIKAALEKQR
jgi:hypothetical protein